MTDLPGRVARPGKAFIECLKQPHYVCAGSSNLEKR